MTTRTELSVETVIVLWSSIEGYIPAKQKQQAAEQFIRGLEEAGFDSSDLYDLREISTHLEKAMQIVFPEEIEYDDDTEY